MISHLVSVLLSMFAAGLYSSVYAQPRENSCVVPRFSDTQYFPGQLALWLATDENYFPTLDSIFTGVSRGLAKTGVVEFDSVNARHGIISISVSPLYYRVDESNVAHYIHREGRSILPIVLFFPVDTDVFLVAQEYCQFPYVRWADQNGIPYAPTVVENLTWAFLKSFIFASRLDEFQDLETVMGVGQLFRGR